MIYLLDLIGVFAFAFCGARVALGARFGTFGVLACAFLPALGGGTVRELLLDRTPGYLTQPEYLGTVLAAALLAAVTQRHAERLSPTITAMDAIGVVTFAYIGAHAAVGAGFPLVGVLFVAVVTAVGGGVICDVLSRRVPQVFLDALCPATAAVVALAYWHIGDRVTQPTNAALLLFGICVLHLLVVRGRAVGSARRARRRRAGTPVPAVRPVAHPAGPVTGPFAVPVTGPVAVPPVEPRVVFRDDVRSVPDAAPAGGPDTGPFPVAPDLFTPGTQVEPRIVPLFAATRPLERPAEAGGRPPRHQLRDEPGTPPPLVPEPR